MIRSGAGTTGDPSQSALSDSSSPGLDPLLCEQEPIHAPGAIQPQGALLAALADGLLVSHASANLAAILGCSADSVLGRPLEQAIGAAACQTLLEAGSSGAIGSDRVHIQAGPGGTSLYLRAYGCGRHVCVDIEPMLFEPPHRLPIIMAQAVLKSFEHAGSAVEVCQLAVQGLRTITGADRVMAYRFGEAGHGQVIAEARETHLEPFLGLRYPATDIPPQARRLFVQHRVNAIADSSYTPVPLLADAALDDGLPIDLSHSALRSASPVHRRYMRNMNTAASLTIGLVQGSDLWGMLVCHYATPRVAGPELRAAAGTIGQVVSLLLASLTESEVLAQRLVRNVTLRAIVDRISDPLPLAEALAASEADLLHLVDAGGAVLRLSGTQILLGRTPAAAEAGLALQTLQAQAGGDVIAFDDLGRRFAELAGCTSAGSGALLLPLALDGGDDAILWFRPELSTTVTWGGNPAVRGSVDPVTAQMLPRASFAAWKETVSGRSAPWTDVDLALAMELRTAVRNEVAQRTLTALRESDAQLGMLAEHSGVVVALSDFDGVRKYVSPASERVLGWRPEDLVGRRALDFIHPEDRQGLIDANKGLLTGGQSSATYRFRRPDGTWLWIDGHARLRTGNDGESPKDYVVVLRDATERKVAELKLIDALDRMEQMAATDGLTGLANRRHLDVAATREWRRCMRDHLPLAVLMLDADRFKLYNDRYGHLAGDDCLRAIALQLSAVARRPGDVAVRYGGEEFLLMLPGTGREGASRVATSLCRQVQALGLPHEGNAGYGVVTVSVGVATCWPGDPESTFADVAALLRAADAALYDAKSGGRNRVVAAGPTPVAGAS